MRDERRAGRSGRGRERAVERAERRVGPATGLMGSTRDTAGPAKRERKRKWRGWAAGLREEVGRVAKGYGLSYFFSSLLFLFLIQTKLNLFEFKLEFEFNPSSQIKK